jgi:hypothetical protein
MATASITTLKPNSAGIAKTTQAAIIGGDTFLNTGREELTVKNGGASSITVTIAAQNPCDQGVLHNQVVTVAASGEEIIGPFRVDRYNDINGMVHVTYSAVTSVTVAVTRVSL